MIYWTTFLILIICYFIPKKLFLLNCPNIFSDMIFIINKVSWHSSPWILSVKRHCRQSVSKLNFLKYLVWNLKLLLIEEQLISKYYVESILRCGICIRGNSVIISKESDELKIIYQDMATYVNILKRLQSYDDLVGLLYYTYIITNWNNLRK